MIVSQKAVLNELVRFAQENHVHLHVRFLSWCRAFSYLQSALGRSESEIKPDSMRLPDVAQVGDTWVAYLHEKDALMHRPDTFSDQLSWRSVPGRMNVSLRYITDLRLLFYWKRLPGHAPDLEPFVLDPTTWETAINSVVSYNCQHEDAVLPPMSFPLALTPNLIHDYAPLVWSGGGRFLDPRKQKMLFSSDQALAIPVFLARNASMKGSANNSYKVLSFPEISHEECCYHFLRARFLATIEQVSFISRWAASFAELHAEKSRYGFWHYAAVAKLPGQSWKGGSDPAVFRHTNHPDLALKLARFIASDANCVEHLAQAGFMPAQMRDFGIGILLDAMCPEGKQRQELATMIENEVRMAREHSPIAQWPTFIESVEVLNGFQRLWRAVGQGDRDNSARLRIQKAAHDLEYSINRNIHLRTRVGYFILQWAWLLLSILLIFFMFAFYLGFGFCNHTSSPEPARSERFRD